MGANCCVAVRSKPSPNDTRVEVSAHRNTRYSPSWSFRWDNRTHIEDIMDNPAHLSHHNSGNVRFPLHSSGTISSEIKSGADTENEGGSPSDTFKKSPINTRTARNSKDGSADQSIGSNSSPEEKMTIISSSIESASDIKTTISSRTPFQTAFNLDPSSSRSRSLPTDPTSSRKARRSPGYQLSRQISDSKIPSLKSLNESSSPEGRQSFVLSLCSNDLSVGGSQGGSSDGWSMRTFTELVASSQRERWSFDSDSPFSIRSKIVRPNAQLLPSLPADVQACGVCSKLLKERSPWSAQKIVPTNELAVVAVLTCGHVYHAECLESETSEDDRFEPPCPVCCHGDRSASKLLRKAKSKASRIAVGDVNIHGESFSECQKEVGRAPQMGASSSMKSSFGRPFLRRHFSFGQPRPSRSVSESETTRKKSFWARYRRD